MSELKYWIWFSQRSGLKPQVRSLLLERFSSPRDIYFAISSDYEAQGLTKKDAGILMQKDLDPVSEIIDACAKLGVSVLTIQDATYPIRLRNIPDPPEVLYIAGHLPAIDEVPAVAIVGTRKATPYGIKMGRRLGYELTKGGALVVSGLAEGVDSAGAQGALRAGGQCVGVLGTAIDVVYPRKNKELFEDVERCGALVSEYPPGAATRRENFPARNRLISGLSVGVTIIEAPARSGSLITAARALEQGRDVFAVPGNADAFNCQGSNDLIKDCAKAVTSGWDILCEYEALYPSKVRKLVGPEAEIPQEQEPSVEEKTDEILPETGEGFAKLRVPNNKKTVDRLKDREYIDLKKQLEGLTESQLKIVAVMTSPSMHIDDIIDLCGLPAASVLSDMTLLQLSGYVVQERGKRFSLSLTGK